MTYDELELAARTATGESALCDFKGFFNPDAKVDWCELVKDIAAMANSGGGCIVFGLDDNGQPTGLDTAGILGYDPADVTNKMLSYTGKHFADFRIASVEKGGMHLACLMVLPARIPLVFTKPGTYPDADNKQKNAFSVGTVYFRHGAKSEPGNSDDLASFLEREITAVREVWLGRLRQVVEAPSEATFKIVPSEGVRLDESSKVTIRLTDNPSAPEYKLADPNVTHPNRQKEVLARLKNAFGGNLTVSSHDLLCVRRLHKINVNPAFCYHGNFSSPTYSHLFVDWLIEQYRADSTFFMNCRMTQKREPAAQDTGDERLRWLSDFMQHKGTAEAARSLKLSQATLSRLIAGKYKGDVPRMLQRIAEYRKTLLEIVKTTD